MSEETNDLIEETNHMDSAEFEAKLTEFFTKHKQSKLRLVSKIAFEFKGKENIVLEHLHNKYVLGAIPEKSKANTGHKLEQHADDIKNIEAPAKDKSKKKHSTKSDESSEKPKSKKKLLVIIIIILVLVGIGVTGFLMKDKIMGKTHASETEAPKAKVESKSRVPKAKKDMTPQQVEAILDSLEPKKSTPKDSTKKK